MLECEEKINGMLPASVKKVRKKNLREIHYFEYFHLFFLSKRVVSAGTEPWVRRWNICLSLDFPPSYITLTSLFCDVFIQSMYFVGVRRYYWINEATDFYSTISCSRTTRRIRRVYENFKTKRFLAKLTFKFVLGFLLNSIFIL